MGTNVNEVNDDRTKVPDEFIFRSVLLFCFTAYNSMCKLIHNRCACISLNLRSISLGFYQNNYSPISECLPRLNLGKYSPMLISPSASNC